MAANRNLHQAKAKKKDEFYTQLVDIENELRHYRQHFRGKVIYCNCDDPRISNFFRYFSLNFARLGLKKLITTCYKNQQMDLFSQHDCEKAIWLEYDGTFNADGVPSLDEIGLHTLEGDGDFRSAECVELLKGADIVVTNPPFSLFREYVAHLIDYDKQFLIIGNMNALTYKEIFPLIKGNKMWLGNYRGIMEFRTPENTISKMGNARWYTNLDHKKRHEELLLYKRYTPEEYPKYFNFDAINVDQTKEIPYDFAGVMGVPISFLDKHNPDQFEIVGLGIANLGKDIGVRPYTPEHRKYRKEIQKRGVVDGDLYMMKNGIVTVPYARVLIKGRS